MRITLDRITVSIHMSEKMFERVLDKDTEVFDTSLNPLYDIVGRMRGVREVDYSGHFGPMIIVTMDAKGSDKRIEGIKKIIKNYIAA